MTSLAGIGASELAPGLKSERLIHQAIIDADISKETLGLLLPDQKPHEYEGSLWDYKSQLPNVSGKIIDGASAPNDDEIAQLIKDVVAFHNSFGGFIVSGIAESSSVALVGCKNTENFAFTVEKLNDRIQGYTKSVLKCRFKTFNFHIDGQRRAVGLLHIPQRAPNTPVFTFAKGAPETKRGQAFKKGDIYARIDDKCVPAHKDKRVVPFACSSRILDQSNQELGKLLDNNLPSRDPNLLRFVGRTEYLEYLWRWMVERNSPLKVLTALGGTGKTSIAFEFCTQIVQTRPVSLEKVVWLSAKKQTYSAIRGEKYSASRVDFDNVSSFFTALARQCGAPENDIMDAEDIDDLIEICFDQLQILPCLIAIDDLDTLDLEGQSELFSQIQALSGRVFAAGSKFLITSRLEFGGATQKIKVGGFPKGEFGEYVKVLSEETDIPIPDSLVDQLRKASLGSPIFAASIFRLARLGTPMHQAIRTWKDRAGEDVRKFAFEREIEHLTDAECRTLFALVTLQETTQSELTQILEIDQNLLLQHLAKIREYHLFASSDTLISGGRLTVPAPILLMASIIRDRVSDPTRIANECARARSKSPKAYDSVSFYIGQVSAAWNEGDFDGALLIAEEGVNKNKKSGDLPSVLGRCYLNISPPRPADADKNFKKAFRNGCAKIELAQFWIEAKRQLQDWVGITEVAQKLPPSDIRGATAYTVAVAEAHLGMIALDRSDFEKAASRFKGSMANIQETIRDGRAEASLPELRELARASARRYVAIVERLSIRDGDKLSIFNAVSEAFDCHISESTLLIQGAVALLNWSQDVFKRASYDSAAAEIMRRKLEKLGAIIAHVDQEDFNRSKLVDDLSRVYHRIDDDLKAYEVAS